MEEAISRFDELTESFTNEGSGWKIIGVENLKLCSAIYEPVGGNSHIKTPSWVSNKKATVNIQNDVMIIVSYIVLWLSHTIKQRMLNVSAPYSNT